MDMHLCEDTRFHMVRTCLMALEHAFQLRNWKFGPIPPARENIMRVGGHSTLVAVATALISAQSGATIDMMCKAIALSEGHDLDEVNTGDVSWPQHFFVERKKREAIHNLFQGTVANTLFGNMLIELEHDTPEQLELIEWHKDGHHVASLLEIKAYISIGLGTEERFRHSIDELRRRLSTKVGKQLYEDIARVRTLPIRSGVGWEQELRHDLGFHLLPVRRAHG